MRTIIRTAVVAVTITATALAVTAGSAYSDARPRAATVTGSAEFALPFLPDQDIRSFTFDARAEPYSRPLPGIPSGTPMDAVGTVRVSHWLADTGMTFTAEAAVDCLVTSPGMATLTAIITRADEPVQDWVGTRVGFGVYDAGPERGGHSRDRVSFTWDVSLDQDDTGEWIPARVGTCLAPAPFAPVTRGGYTVHHADLVAPPTGTP